MQVSVRMKIKREKNKKRVEYRMSGIFEGGRRVN